MVAPLLGTGPVGLLTNLDCPIKLSCEIRLVALFEGAKGALILLTGFGLLALVHCDLQDVADELVRRFHLNPARHYPRIFIEAADKVTDTRLWLLAGAALLYALVRFVEAYGLWRERRWAGWFAAVTPYLYLRTTTEGRIIVGGEDENFVNAKRRDALIFQKTRTLVNKFGRLFPDLQLEVAYAWAGTFGETKDGLAYIGVHPRFPHAYFALGYGGNGITFSLIAAQIIRDHFLGRTNRDAHLFRFRR